MQFVLAVAQPGTILWICHEQHVQPIPAYQSVHTCYLVRLNFKIFIRLAYFLLRASGYICCIPIHAVYVLSFDPYF